MRYSLSQSFIQVLGQRLTILANVLSGDKEMLATGVNIQRIIIASQCVTRALRKQLNSPTQSRCTRVSGTIGSGMHHSTL